MATYMSAPEFGMPRPPHTQTPSALEAVERVRRVAYETKMRRVSDALVSDHGRVAVAPFDGPVVPAAAHRLLALAAAHGFRVNLVELSDRCAVEGVKGTTAFRATYVRGKTAGATWHERDYRYAIVEDQRPEPQVNKLTRTSIAKRRPVGVPRHHLTIVASPVGISLGVTVVTERIKAS